MGSVSEEAVMRDEGGEEMVQEEPEEETPGEVIWGGPSDWQHDDGSTPLPVGDSTAWLLTPASSTADSSPRPDRDEHDVTLNPADTSMDIVAQLDEAHDHALRATAAPRRNANTSDVPSITPATTKRARANSELTSPVRKAVKASPNMHLNEFGAGKVRDRVKAIEAARAKGEQPASSPTSNTTLQPLPPAARRKTTSKKQGERSHGLVPRGQLFVANPDDEA